MSGIDSPSEGGNEMAAVTVVQLRNIRRLTLLFILGLFLSGLTAIPLKFELNLLVNLAAPDSAVVSQVGRRAGSIAMAQTIPAWFSSTRPNQKQLNRVRRQI